MEPHKYIVMNPYVTVRYTGLLYATVEGTMLVLQYEHEAAPAIIECDNENDALTMKAAIDHVLGGGVTMQMIFFENRSN